ncbi:MAG: cell division protein [Romboutsia sp.]
MKIAESAKIIGIGQEGINTIDSISNKLNKNLDLEKININQDVDKEYVRTLLDGVEILFLTYSIENKKACEIVKAIGYMAGERRVLSIGLNSSTKINTDEFNINREFNISDENRDELLSLINMMLNSMLDTCMINIDLTDIKEVLASDKGIKYSYNEFSNNSSNEEIVKFLFDNIKQSGEELICKKGIILLEMGSNDFKSEDMIGLNDLLTLIQEANDETYESIFSMYLKEELQGKVKVGLIFN